EAETAPDTPAFLKNESSRQRQMPAIKNEKSHTHTTPAIKNEKPWRRCRLGARDFGLLPRLHCRKSCKHRPKMR
ncbi:hypothetical protein, partial [Pollutimonas bauzanensis]|uniref:hypothetical protein n=1 Tax=Pollutimonas bauzanensis TaxID=658167 RepID=UPI003342CF88